MSRVQHQCLSCEQGEANSRRYMLTKKKGDKSPAGGTKRRASAGAGNHVRMDQQTLSEKKRRKWRIRQERHRTENRRAKGRILTRHVDGLEDSQSKAMHDLAAFGSSTLTSLTARFFLRSVVSCKDLCMLLHKVPLLIPPSLTAPIADHCLKRAVRCLYDSHANRHKALLRPKTGGGRGVAFGWMPIEALYYENCTSLSPQVTFKRRDVFRDTSWRCVSMLTVYGMISLLVVCKNLGV